MASLEDAVGAEEERENKTGSDRAVVLQITQLEHLHIDLSLLGHYTQVEYIR